MSLALAFGLSLAVNRYETRRAAVVDESNPIGTTYLRAQTLPEPVDVVTARIHQRPESDRRPTSGSRSQRPFGSGATVRLAKVRQG